MADDEMQGTGDTMAKIDLGVVGTVIVEDDGDPDNHCKAWVEMPNGGTAPNLGRAVKHARREYGDRTVMDELARAAGSEAGDDDIATTYRAPSFACDDCGKTWPGSANENPGSGDDLCPECA